MIGGIHAKKMLGDVIYTHTYVYIAFYFSCLPFLIRNHSDEQWRVDRSITFHRLTTWYRTPPPLLVGVGAEEMTARRLYISWPGHQSNYSTANLYTGRVNRLWGRGPKTRAPRCEGEEAAYSTLGQEHCPKKQRQPCSEGHTKGPVWIPRSSVHVGTRVPQWRDERVLQGDLQPQEPLD